MHEENNTPQPSQPPAPANAVWISREEYDRLRQAETSSQPVAASAPVQSNTVHVQEIKDTQATTKATILGVLAIALFVGFTTSLLNGAWVSIILLIFFGVSVLGALDYIRKNQNSVSIKDASKNIAKILLVTAIVLSMLPMIYIAGVIVIFVIMVGLGGGDIGS